MFRFWKSACWFIFILGVTLLPGSTGKRIRLFTHADKIIHLLLFFIFSLLLISDAKKFFQSSSIKKEIVTTVVLAGMLTGLFTELVQFFLITGRSGTFGDLLADIGGVVIGLFIYKTLDDRFKS
jgi:VanZ family protein